MGVCISSSTAVSKELVGKEKYILDVGAVMQHVDEKRGEPGVLVCYCPKSYRGLSLSFQEFKTNRLFSSEYTDEQLAVIKDGAGVTHNWGSFFKSIASDITKNKANVTLAGNAVHVFIMILSSKDPESKQPFKFTLEETSSGPLEVQLKILGPMTRMVQKRRLGSDADRELRLARLDFATVATKASLEWNSQSVGRLQPTIPSLQDSSRKAANEANRFRQDVTKVERRLRKIRMRLNTEKHPLDKLYENGGPMYFQHMQFTVEHVPKENEDIPALNSVLTQRLPLKYGEQPSALAKPLSSDLSKMYNQSTLSRVSEALQILVKLDDWDFNVFALESATDNNALYYTTYTILCKLKLISTLGIDDKILRNFLSAIQAGYHPNPYHNATHAADVTQGNYVILVCCELHKVLRLSNVQLLAAILAATVHDYDHPGFNNLFHSRTGAYLATLYNDRSVLENHHLACVFEMLRMPKYNFVAHFKEEQYRDFRETMVEMVLATDMGLHAKILSVFQRRLQETAKSSASEWSSTREDVQLALSMCIKMADIANVGRKNDLYKQWARKIAAEFFLQGDAERCAGYGVSPFMERSKYEVEFPTGQTSFMNYIAHPLCEALLELAPKAEFVLKGVSENTEFWSKTQTFFAEEDHV